MESRTRTAASGYIVRRRPKTRSGQNPICLNGFDVRRRFDDLDLHNERRRSEVCFLAFGKAPLPAAYDEQAVMDLIHEPVAGLDVHNETA